MRVSLNYYMAKGVYMPFRYHNPLPHQPHARLLLCVPTKTDLFSKGFISDSFYIYFVICTRSVSVLHTLYLCNKLMGLLRFVSFHLPIETGWINVRSSIDVLTKMDHKTFGIKYAGIHCEEGRWWNGENVSKCLWHQQSHKSFVGVYEKVWVFSLLYRGWVEGVG